MRENRYTILCYSLGSRVWLHTCDSSTMPRLCLVPRGAIIWMLMLYMAGINDKVNLLPCILYLSPFISRLLMSPSDAITSSLHITQLFKVVPVCLVS